MPPRQNRLAAGTRGDRVAVGIQRCTADRPRSPLHTVYTPIPPSPGEGGHPLLPGALCLHSPVPAQAAGKYKGRKAALTGEQADELRARLAAGESVTALAKELGISRHTVYNYMSA